MSCNFFNCCRCNNVLLLIPEKFVNFPRIAISYEILFQVLKISIKQKEIKSEHTEYQQPNNLMSLKGI